MSRTSKWLHAPKYQISRRGLPRCESSTSKNKLPPLKGAHGLTDYPLKGDDEPIVFESSQYAWFPLEFALAIAREYPREWCKGGNHFGNHAFSYYIDAVKAVREGRRIPAKSRRWMKKREQYIARHRKDFRVAGVVAMIKWAGYIDGSYGDGAIDGSTFDEMLDVIKRGK
tara:strand:- start:4150 stop:4659 length:510 start_codon:yes stop_codon:yes gene_type:complete